MYQTQQGPVSGPVAPGQYGGMQVAGPTAYMPAQTGDTMTQMMGWMMPMIMMFLMIGLIMPMVKGIGKYRVISL